jgi:hypothetical protein
MTTKTIASATNTELGDAGTGGEVRKVIHLISSSFVGTITVKARAAGSPAATAYVPIPYKSRYVNGAVGTEAFVTTGLTGTSLIEVNATGLDISLDTTAAFTSGSMLAYINDIRV